MTGKGDHPPNNLGIVCFLTNKKFITDLMLGKLARYMRILGYDTIYPRYVTDEDIIARALKEKRVIITRDKALYARAVKKGIEAVLIKGINVKDALSQLYSKGFIQLDVDLEKTRCPRCNHLLKKVEEPPLKTHPKDMRKKYYFICEKCGSIYWIGKHWRNILETIEEARRNGNTRARGSDS